ncbi:MAG: Uma2 family endonuclease [Clostridia bacterium]|nr:Uma2 family endonuclease [Clostridia bacterium]
MAGTGVFREDDRLELVEGEILEMTPIGSAHAACVARLTHAFSRLAGRSVLFVQSPVRLSERSLPQPDLALLRWRDDFYAAEHPGPADVLLAVEVADTPLAYDRDVKVPLYARAGVSEVWLVDLDGGALWVYRNPTPAGYGWVRRLGRRERLGVEAFPDFAVAVDEVLDRAP